MPSETLAPDVLLEQVNRTGTVADIDESVDSPDAAWLVAPGSNSTCTVRVSFPMPSGNPTVGAGLQTLRAWLRKTNHSTNPAAVLSVCELNGSNLAATSSTTISSTSGQMLALTFNANLLSAANGSDVEARIVGTVGGGGAGNRGSVEIGAVEWNVEYDEAPAGRIMGSLVGQGGGLIGRGGLVG